LRAIQQAEARIGELSRRQAAAPTLNILRDQAATFAEVAPLVRDDEALLQILVAPGESFAFLVHAGAVKVARVEVEGRIIGAAVGKLKDAFIVRSSGGGKSIGAFDVKLAHLLYTRLLGPFAAELQDVHRLVVVPSGPLLGLRWRSSRTTAHRERPRLQRRVVPGRARQPGRRALDPRVRRFAQTRRCSGAAALLGMGDFVPAGDPEPLLRPRPARGPPSERPAVQRTAAPATAPSPGDGRRARADDRNIVLGRPSARRSCARCR
jgi:hypothetical protein